jgi:hypothetical protein
MHTEFEALLHKAEEQYLQKPGMLVFKHQIASLTLRLETYELLRDQEIAIFQSVADQLLETFSSSQTQLLEKALMHWLAVMRYAAMAMLLHQPEFLQHRLLEWLTDIVQIHPMQDIEMKLYPLLMTQLQKVLSEQQMALMQPFVEQARTALINTSTSPDLTVPPISAAIS